jgi:hypothetical protein
MHAVYTASQPFRSSQRHLSHRSLTLAVSGVLFFFSSCCVEASVVSCAHDTLLGSHAARSVPQPALGL